MPLYSLSPCLTASLRSCLKLASLPLCLYPSLLPCLLCSLPLHYLFICLSALLSLSLSLSSCISASLPICLSISLSPCLFSSLPTCLSFFLLSCLSAILPLCYAFTKQKPYVPATVSALHCKKRLATFPSPAGTLLTKLSLGGNTLIIPAEGEFGKDYSFKSYCNLQHFLVCNGSRLAAVHYV